MADASHSFTERREEKSNQVDIFMIQQVLMCRPFKVKSLAIIFKMFVKINLTL